MSDWDKLTATYITEEIAERANIGNARIWVLRDSADLHVAWLSGCGFAACSSTEGGALALVWVSWPTTSRQDLAS